MDSGTGGIATGIRLKMKGGWRTADHGEPAKGSDRYGCPWCEWIGKTWPVQTAILAPVTFTTARGNEVAELSRVGWDCAREGRGADRPPGGTGLAAVASAP